MDNINEFGQDVENIDLERIASNQIVEFRNSLYKSISQKIDIK